MKTAIFGGTFNPIHTAHLAMARAAADIFGLDRVLFIPAGNPPHKETGTPYEHRFRMVEIACAVDPRFVPSRIEEGSAKSYSIVTIEKLKPAGGQLFFIIGSDAFEEITTWFRWQDVLKSVEFIVVSRPGHKITVPEGARVHKLETVELPVSSSEIRRALAAGLTPEVVPVEVLRYIRENKLYGVQAGFSGRAR
ncbi:MAG: nicotinate-nucleotide adenylyltransferase [Bryobacteraceae bacterium]